MLVGTDFCIAMVFVWEETGDHMTISHADAGYWTQVAEVRGKCVTTAPARQP